MMDHAQTPIGGKSPLPSVEHTQNRDLTLITVEDETFLRYALQKQLQQWYPGATVHGFASVRPLSEMPQEGRSPIVVLDLRLPGHRAVMSAVEAVLETMPKARIVVYSGLDDPRFMADARALGAYGWVTKASNSDPEQHLKELHQAISRAIQGGRSFPLSEEATAGAEAAHGLLTELERSVFECFVRSPGAKNNDVADVLGVSNKSVEHAMARVKRKLGMKSIKRAELVATLLEMGLISRG